MFYKRYIDHTFALFSSPDNADKLKEYLSSKHPNINFWKAKEKDVRLCFSDINKVCENKKFPTNIQKKTKELQWGFYRFQKFYTRNL